MLVLRLENKDRKLCTRGRPAESLNAATDWNPLPSPYNDMGYKTVNYYEDKHGFEMWNCGVANWTQYKIWWKPEKLKELRKSRTVILDVKEDEVLKGKYQVIFPRRKARIVGEVDHTRLKPKWYKPLKHSSTTEKERLFR